MISTIDRWTIDFDQAATQECYLRAPAEHYCACDNCRKFGQAIAFAFPTNFLTILVALGIDARRTVELSHYGLEKSALHLTEGWFHVVGRICAVGERGNLTGQGRVRDDLNIFEGDFKFGFSEKRDLAPPSFDGRDIIELYFVTRIPRLIAAPEPE